MSNKYIFKKGERYLTRGINELLPLALQMLLWEIIDELVKSEVTTDYLQVFTFEVTDKVTLLTHMQEQPEYKKVYEYPLRKEFEELNQVKIYVIDDLTHSTMLLASEY